MRCVHLADKSATTASVSDESNKTDSEGLRARLRRLTDGITAPSSGEMAPAFALGFIDADRFAALTPLLPPEFVVRAFAPGAAAAVDAGRASKRAQAIAALLLGGERTAAARFGDKLPAGARALIQELGDKLRQRWVAHAAQAEHAPLVLDAATKGVELDVDLDVETLAQLVFFSCDAATEHGSAFEAALSPLITALLATNEPSDSRALSGALRQQLERRAEFLSALEAALRSKLRQEAGFPTGSA